MKWFDVFRTRPKAVLLVLAGFLLILAGWAFLSRGRNPATNLVLPIPQDEDLVVANVHHEARQGGNLEWVVDARTAAYGRETETARLEEITAVFYPQDGEPVHVRADQGFIRTGSQDVDLFGNVEVTQENSRILTEKLAYDHARGRISTDVPVDLFSRGVHVRGNALDYDLQTEVAVLTGNVAGVFNE